MPTAYVPRQVLSLRRLAIAAETPTVDNPRPDRPPSRSAQVARIIERRPQPCSRCTSRLVDSRSFCGAVFPDLGLSYTTINARVGSRRRMSSGSLVTTRRPRVCAQSTTVASITSVVPLAPQSWPADRAPKSSSATTSTAPDPSSLARRAWRRPSRQTCPITPTGTDTGSARSRARTMKPTAVRSERSNAMSAPASRVAPIAIPLDGRLPPARRRSAAPRFRRASSRAGHRDRRAWLAPRERPLRRPRCSVRVRTAPPCELLRRDRWGASLRSWPSVSYQPSYCETPARAELARVDRELKHLRAQVAMLEEQRAKLVAELPG